MSMLEELERGAWNIPAYMGCETKGLNDSGIETFNGHIVSALAREICQNSLDAQRSRESPVIVEFSIFKNSQMPFPGEKVYHKMLHDAHEFWKKRENEQADKFFKEVNKKLKKEIYWMRVSDFNTTGLVGVSKAKDPSIETAWSSLVKSTGVSKKRGSSGGSFGIGKYAPFSCSQLRTVFYATKTVDNEEGFIGVARLVSFLNEKNIMTTGVYYFESIKDSSPLPKCISLDPNFKRETIGTDVYIPAFLPMYSKKSWKDEIVNVVLDGFLYAIFDNRLVVKIKVEDEEILLNKEFLATTYENGQMSKDVKQKYLLLTSPDVKIYRHDVGNLGYVQVRYLLGSPEYDRRVTMIRMPGMKIFDKDRFAARIAFTGMAIIFGDELNELFRSFENPEHTKWEFERNSTNESYANELYRFCRKELLELVKVEETDEIDSGLGAILPQEGADGDKQLKDTLTCTIIDAEQKKKKTRKKREETDEDGPDGGKTQEKEDFPSEGFDVFEGSGGAEHGTRDYPINEPGKGGALMGDNRGPNEGENGGKPTDSEGSNFGQTSTVDPEHLPSILCKPTRYFCQSREAGVYRLILNPTKDCAEAYVKISCIAESGVYTAPLIAARNVGSGKRYEINPSKGRIDKVAFSKGKPIVLELTFDYSDYLSLEVKCHGSH